MGNTLGFHFYSCILFFLTVLLLESVNSTVYAASNSDPVSLTRIDQPVVLDGMPDEPFWQTIEPFPLVEHTPVYGSGPLYPTEIRVAYDDQYLYLSAVCITPPDDLFLTSFRRDHVAASNDYIAIVLDTFNDNETALSFSVIPTGARVDMAFFDDAQTSGSFNSSWNTFWDAETVITDDGWTVEIRIPFSSLRFQDDNGRVEMGMIVYRWFATNVSVATYPPIPPNWGFWSFAKPSKAQKIVMEDVYSKRAVYITPYVLGGIDQNYLMNPSGTRYSRDDSYTGDVGLDVKYSLTNNLTLDVTVNTDFAQVEADDQQVNLTRFSLFFPEKRLFFQERSSIFTFGTLERSGVGSGSTTNQLFYSRRIGLFQGQPVPLLGGVRLVGRAGGWDIGVLNMQTQRVGSFFTDGNALPSENFGVVRLRRQAFNPYSYIGVMATSRYDTEGHYNLAWGLDGNIRVFDNDYLTLSLAQTADSDISFGFADPESSHMHARWERRSQDGFGYDLNLSRSGGLYNPGTGFILRRVYTRIGDRLFYGWFPGEASPLQKHQIYLNWAAFYKNSDGAVETLEYGPSWSGTLKSGDNVNLSLTVIRDNLISGFSLSDRAEVPAGEYEYVQAGASWEIFYRYTTISFADRDQDFHSHLGRLSVNAAVNRALSAAGLIQYNSAARGVFVNLRIRYNRREGNDFYLVYNEGYNTERGRESVRLPFTSSRAILLKYSHTLIY
ncbi:MAG: carbohydrate binding family 9 domain-containing protein [Rhodothermaceae bacterium]|nr:carbohydrate binding family 9 domain-containing protein [Rhodothermaceae bacterium]